MKVLFYLSIALIVSLFVFGKYVKSPCIYDTPKEDTPRLIVFDNGNISKATDQEILDSLCKKFHTGPSKTNFWLKSDTETLIQSNKK